VFFREAARRRVGILARLPLSSGLLTGRITRETHFAADDHRAFNRNGEAFDRGETFSGVPYDVGLAAVDDLRAELASAGSRGAGAEDAGSKDPAYKNATLAQFALRWTLMFDAVTCAIPGARTPEQARANTAASDLPPIAPYEMRAIEQIYDRRIRPHVHRFW
jgi:aryl-alcohol dehydrogenase-like predicted oxidoreductase